MGGNDSNKSVLTWFHIIRNDKRVKFIPLLNNRVEIVHTASHITKKELIKHRLDLSKVRVILLGVDLQRFYAVNKDEKKKIRWNMGLSNDKFIIGSFQKDGVGWKNGNKPKLEKGLAIFIKAVKALSKKQDIFVLLTGPDRGYVIKKLERYRIPYKYIYLKR